MFGGIYKGNSPYGLETGYTGKPYDAVTGLSDYGFRDYSPKYARFITEDPIRDGENWFSYVSNNPVNWVYPWGLAMQEAALESDHCGGGGWKNNVIVAGFLALLYDASKGTVPPIPSAPTPLSPPGKQTPVMESYPPAENGLGSNKQNTTNLKGK